MVKLTAIILSRGGNVNPLVTSSVSFADEVLIVSEEDYPMDRDFAKQRNLGLKMAKGDWVLFVDDDEYVGTELANEILERINKTKLSGFYIPRFDMVFHDLQLYGETGNTKLLRLAKKNAGKFIRPVHEYWDVGASVGNLKNPLYHVKDNFISQFIGRIMEYGPIDANILKQEGKPFSFWRQIFFPVAKFFKNYFLLLGFLDGIVGLFHAYLMSVQSLSVRIFQWETKES